MANMGHIRKIKARVKSFLNLNDAQLMQWWRTPNATFDNKTPESLSKTAKGLAKLDQIISYSTEPLAPESDKNSKTNPVSRDQMEMNLD